MDSNGGFHPQTPSFHKDAPHVQYSSFFSWRFEALDWKNKPRCFGFSNKQINVQNMEPLTAAEKNETHASFPDGEIIGKWWVFHIFPSKIIKLYQTY